MSGEASNDTNLGPKTNENPLETDSIMEQGGLYKVTREIFFYLKTSGDLPSDSNALGALGTLIGNTGFNRVTTYFFEHGAATSSVLVNRLCFPDRSIRAYISQLSSWGIIRPCRKARTMGSIHGDRGRIPDVWETPDATIDQVNEAIQLHRRTKSPKYRVAETFAQSYLHDFLEPRGRKETTYRDLLEEAKARGFQEPRDIADLACQYFNKETSIHAWR